VPIISLQQVSLGLCDGGGDDDDDDDDGVGNWEYGACMSCPLTDWRYACMLPLLTFGQEFFHFFRSN
jgi:hypothetical protein